MGNDQNRDQFEQDSANKDTTGQSGQTPPSAEQGKQPEFGQKTDDTTGQQDGQSSTGQSSSSQSESASGGDTALDTKTETETGQGQSSETGQQSSSFVGSQSGTGNDDYLRKNENQETAQKGSEGETDIEGSSNS